MDDGFFSEAIDDFVGSFFFDTLFESLSLVGAH